MGNGIGKIGICFTGGGSARRAHHGPPGTYLPDPYDEGLGHSFCYVRPDPARLPAAKIHSEDSGGGVSIFRSISGASVSANTSTNPLSAAAAVDPTAAMSGPLFDCSTSFASVPLHPIPRSGPFSGPITDRAFLSGPIDRAGLGGFLSGPLDRAGPIFSGPLDRSFSTNGSGFSARRRRPGSLIRGIRRAISRTLGSSSSVVAPVKGQDSWIIGTDTKNACANETTVSSDTSLDDVESWESQNLQWAQGKAGEDRVHVVVSEEHGWVFVGIYDGFSGPDATDYLLGNLYTSVQKELKGLLWDDSSKSDSSTSSSSNSNNSCDGRSSTSSSDVETFVCDFSDSCYATSSNSSSSSCTSSGGESINGNANVKKGKNSKGGKYRGGGAGNKWEENQRRWKCEWDRERLELDRRLKEQWSRNRNDSRSSINHSDVLKALSRALKKTEEGYLDIADKMVDENPELALMGSCVLAMLMKGEDVYVMNVGDSRAVLAQNKEVDLRLGKIDQDLERINEESLYDFQVSDGVKPTLDAFQLTMDHSTSVEEEVLRIRDEHPDDPFAVVNDRVKGSLKVTRAFGAGFLKQPKWNDALLEMFRIDYVGTSPYLNCLPSLCHHRLGPKDQFLILSSDGLYQYFTNEEAVAEVELFISLTPEGDPAQHLVEEVLLRAAKKAGMDFYELLEIPQGDRRRYHDDVSIIIISFEGRIWRYCV